MEISEATTVNIAERSTLGGLATGEQSYRSSGSPSIMSIAEETTTRASATRDEGQRQSREWPTKLKIILDRQRPFLPKWKMAFVTSCVFAVLLDPLFFYIPIVKNDMKCIGLDKRLEAIVISLRSATDLFYIVDITIQIYIEPKVPTYRVMGRSYLHTMILTKGMILVEDALAMAKLIWRVSSHILIDFLAVLPIPQAIILIFLDSSSLNTRKFLAFLALLQYVPRTLRIYLLCTDLNKTPMRETEVWILFKGAFSFFLYILASHVFGAFWYFLAIQRETSCWQYACQSDSGCERTTFYCNDRTIRNITILNNVCSINPQNTKSFDYGMFLDAVQHSVLESTNLPKKFFHCFWWGLRNLSSLGQNLETSIYTWENIFAVFISIAGLLLVLLYLTTNLKICMQLVTRSSERVKIIRQMKIKDLEVQFWLSENDIPKNMKTLIMQNVHKQLEQNKDVHVRNILSILPLEQKRFIKRHLCLPMLKKVPMLRVMDEEVLKAIFDNLKPVSYSEDTYIIGEGEPIVKMIFITQGILLTYSTNSAAAGTSSSAGSSTTKCLERGDFHGEELLNWASTFSPFSSLPVSTRFVKSLTKVEAFALMASDLKILASQFWRHFSTEVGMPRQLCANLIQSKWRSHDARRALRRTLSTPIYYYESSSSPIDRGR